MSSALVDLTRADDRSPLRVLLDARNVEALRLLVRLYEIQDLPEYGGVHWRALRLEFERGDPVRSRGWNVWSFRSERRRYFKDQFPGLEDSEAFFEALHAIESAGLLECVLTLVEADEVGAAMIFPIGVARNGSLARGGPEAEIGAAASDAAERLAGNETSHDADFIVPARPIQQNVQLVGVLRLIYRAKTAATAEWMAGLAETRDEWCERLSEIRPYGTTSREIRRGTTSM